VFGSGGAGGGSADSAGNNPFASIFASMAGMGAAGDSGSTGNPFASMFGGMGGRGAPGASGPQRRSDGRRAQPEQPAASLYKGVPHVVELTKSTFKSTVGKDARGDAIWLLKLYSPACVHCQQLVPVISKLADALQGIVHVGVVNCDTEASICSGYGCLLLMVGFPSPSVECVGLRWQLRQAGSDFVPGVEDSNSRGQG
jgi:hypothetical protein